jgi:hypothetical protein
VGAGATLRASAPSCATSVEFFTLRDWGTAGPRVLATFTAGEWRATWPGGPTGALELYAEAALGPSTTGYRSPAVVVTGR